MYTFLINLKENLKKYKYGEIMIVYKVSTD